MSITAEDVARRCESAKQPTFNSEGMMVPCSCQSCSQADAEAALVRSLERIRVAAEGHRSLNMLATRDQHAVDHAAYLLYSALDAHRKEFGE